MFLLVLKYFIRDSWSQWYYDLLVDFLKIHKNAFILSSTPLSLEQSPRLVWVYNNENWLSRSKNIVGKTDKKQIQGTWF